MKAFFITNFDHPEALSVGKEHVHRVNDYGNFEAALFKAIVPTDLPAFIKENPLKFLKRKYQNDTFKERNRKQKYNKKSGILGCFCSHYSLWHKCVQLNEPIGIFEYDAFQTRIMPKEYVFDDFLYLSGWRNMNGNPNDYKADRKGSGVFPYVGYDSWGYKNVISGSHAYLIRPHAAQHLIDAANEKGWFAMDRFFSTDLVSIKKQTLVPAVFKVRKSLFTTFNSPELQVVLGKHQDIS